MLGFVLVCVLISGSQLTLYSSTNLQQELQVFNGAKSRDFSVFSLSLVTISRTIWLIAKLTKEC